MPISNPYERARAAAANLSTGDFGAAATAMFTPTSLSPRERRSVAERYLGNDPGPLQEILEVVSNPLIIGGLVLTMMYKVPTASRALDFSNRLQAYARKIPPGMHWLRDFHETFKGTPLPTYFEQVVRTNHMHMKDFTQKFADAVGRFTKKGNVFDRKTSIRISAKLDGLDNPKNQVWGALRSRLGKAPEADLGSIPSIRLTAAEQELAGDVSFIMRGQWGLVKQGLKAATGNSAKYKRSTLMQLRKLGIGLDDLTDLDDYFPHIEALTKSSIRERHREWFAAIQGSGLAARAQAEGMPPRVLAKNIGRRTGAMIPSEDDLEYAGLLTPKLKSAMSALSRVTADKVASSPEGTVLHLKRYSLDLLKVSENYTRAMARTTAWNVPPGPSNVSLGNRIVDELKDLSIRNPVKANMVKDTYIPLSTGQLSWEQALPSMAFSEAKEWAATTLTGLKLPKGVRDVLTKPLAMTQDISWQRLGRGIQGYLYQTTMGFNPLSPAKNLLQSVITTVPLIGPGYTAKGMSEVAKRSSKYFGLMRKGMPKEKAFRESFREFAETGFDVGKVKPLEMTLDAMNPGIRLPSKARDTLDAVSDASLKMFTTSENFNRLVAFYGGRAKAVAEIAGKDYYHPLAGKTVKLLKGTEDFEFAATQYADLVARQTQFGGGPLNAPYGTLKWWAPFRQFTLFPLRVAGFVTGPGNPLTAEGRGVFGRMMLGSGLTYEVAQKAFDADVSQALMFGALPEATENKPFAPFPFVSPFLQILGATATAAAQGDLDDLQKIIPLVTPFGVAGSRAASVAFPKVASTIGRPYVDYDTPTADGRYALYTKTNSLIGYYTPAGLLAKAVGLGDVSSQKERALMEYLLKQRDVIRDFRKQYMEALAANDVRRATQIGQAYEKKYPGLGGIQIKKSDLEALQLRRQIPRLEMLLGTLPPSQRAQLAGVIATSLGAGASSLLGVDPSLFATGTPKSRMGMRPRRPRMSGLPSPAQSGDTPQGMGEAARAAGYQRRDELVTAGFRTFDSF